jgi:hypothetical protein
LSTISYRFHSFEKNGIPIYFGWPKNIFKTKYKTTTTLPLSMITCTTKPPRLKYKQRSSFILQDFNTLKEARKVSDHIPIWFEFSLAIQNFKIIPIKTSKNHTRMRIMVEYSSFAVNGNCTCKAIIGF